MKGVEVMDVRYSPDKNGFARLTTDELRKSFLIESLFAEDKIPLIYSDIDRSITGSAVPVIISLKLTATKKEMAAEYFTERREIGKRMIERGYCNIVFIASLLSFSHP